VTDTIRIAALQHHSTPADLAASLARMEKTAISASAEGAQLLVFPEASLTGYNNSTETMQRVAEPADGNAAKAIAKICQQHNIAIAYGFAEKTEQHIYNSVQFIGNSGESIALYRKTHLWGEQDRTLFAPGEDLVPIVEWNGWQIGLLICYDVEFPETVRRLALEGAELILNPTALMAPWTTVADQVVPVRAYENQLFIAYTNFCGQEHEQQYVGHSCIVGPDGNTLAQAGDDEELIIATLERSQIATTRQALPYHRDRRPELYRALVTDE